jgi:hypothetical protein
MGRNLYILGATLGLLALICIALSFTNIAQQPGSPGDIALWRTSGIVLFCIASVIALGGILSTLFEQAERRAEADRKSTRRSRQK